MSDFLIKPVVAFLLSVIAVWILRPMADRFGLSDIPTGHKRHRDITPLVGGLAIYAACFLSYLPTSGIKDGNLFMPPLLLIGLLLVVVGALDDKRDLGVGIRFGVQISAGLIAALSADIMISDLGHLLSENILGLAWMSVPFTVFAVVGGINAMNMADGLDGLAGSLATVTFLLLATVAYFADQAASLLQLLVLSAAILGFLAFNLRLFGRKAAGVFMGDAGSMFLGFAIAWYLIDLADSTNRAMTPVTALWVFAFPLIDTVSVMIRRVVLGRSPFAPDHEHLHHILLRLGFSVNQTVLIIVLIHAVMGGIGILTLYIGTPEFLMFYAFLLIFAMYFFATMHAWRLERWLLAKISH